ncbi:putative F-box protein [Cardamine amara subsp. amara]|uniref:F-box protein n=1 Tax=Cardamine amara subsp. amara TaxID=228776 RepID=A0ABD1A4K5_CARAN
MALHILDKDFLCFSQFAMEEKHHNPKSHTCLRLDMSHFWSELPLDLLSLVFERLSYANFQRAKSVCSPWYSASRQSVPQKHQIHWLILSPENNNKNSSCMLFNPEEKDKLYKTQDLSVEFTKNICIATNGSWLLM